MALCVVVTVNQSCLFNNETSFISELVRVTKTLKSWYDGIV